MRAVVLLLLIVACDSSTKPRSALDYVALCAPGQHFDNCNRALRKVRAVEKPSPNGKKPVIPVNDLVKIDVEGALLFDARAPLTTPTRGAFKHMMIFRDGYGTVRARVLELLVAKLGEPTRIKGSPPIDDPRCPDGDYWMATDGIWILSNTMVTWYSRPIDGLGRKSGFPWDDKYRQAAPASSALWRSIGHVLVTY